MRKIVACRIGPYPRPMPAGMFDPMPAVRVRFDDGAEQVLFSFYPDELQFSEDEVIGLTEVDAQALFTQKDVAYLRRA